MLETEMILVSNPMFWGMGNHLGPFSEVLDRREGQEQGGGAVGGQGQLQGVKEPDQKSAQNFSYMDCIVS